MSPERIYERWAHRQIDSFLPLANTVIYLQSLTNIGRCEIMVENENPKSTKKPVSSNHMINTTWYLHSSVVSTVIAWLLPHHSRWFLLLLQKLLWSIQAFNTEPLKLYYQLWLDEWFMLYLMDNWLWLFEWLVQSIVYVLDWCLNCDYVYRFVSVKTCDLMIHVTGFTWYNHLYLLELHTFCCNWIVGFWQLGLFLWQTCLFLSSV